MEAADIRFIEATLGLASNDLAKALGVAPITVARWEQGLNAPTGLQAEVLQGLFNVALSIQNTRDQQHADTVRGLVTLGIGALIFYLLNQNR